MIPPSLSSAHDVSTCARLFASAGLAKCMPLKLLNMSPYLVTLIGTLAILKCFIATINFFVSSALSIVTMSEPLAEQVTASSALLAETL